jgi:hypothetical protein
MEIRNGFRQFQAATEIDHQIEWRDFITSRQGLTREDLQSNQRFEARETGSGQATGFCAREGKSDKEQAPAAAFERSAGAHG